MAGNNCNTLYFPRYYPTQFYPPNVPEYPHNQPPSVSYAAQGFYWPPTVGTQLAPMNDQINGQSPDLILKGYATTADTCDRGFQHSKDPSMCCNAYGECKVRQQN